MKNRTSEWFLRNAVFLLLSAFLILFLAEKAAAGTAYSSDEEIITDYESRLFDASRIHMIDIRISEEDLADLIENASEKNKYRADVTIDGELYEEIAVSAKGSASLWSVAKDPDSDRYSLKLTFDRYRKSQTYYGLDTLHLNNNVSDASYMRDFISYSMFRRMGFPAPLTSYAAVSVNGEAYGFFLALEGVGDSFLSRTLDGEGRLYKPEHSSTAAGSTETLLGADLVYTDNLPLSYRDIFDNAETDCSGKDEKAVIRALQALSEGNISEGIDTDMVCRYFAVHNFTLNSDSYLNVIHNPHNYYLYERDGKLAMLPWDYNNAYALTNSIVMDFLLVNADETTKAKVAEKWASVKSYPASYFINKGIDTPLTGESSSRPMWSFIPENREFLELYHTYMEQLISEYFESGLFEEEFSRIYDMICPYVEADSSRIYTMQEFKEEAERLKTICVLRAESIRKQLDGRLSCDSTTQDETEWVDAAVLDCEWGSE